jgi:hypothetical protein
VKCDGAAVGRPENNSSGGPQTPRCMRKASLLGNNTETRHQRKITVIFEHVNRHLRADMERHCELPGKRLISQAIFSDESPFAA